MTVEELIENWWGHPGGQEHANFHPFISDLCELLGVPRPGAAEKGKLGSYVYEASIPGGSFRSTKGTGAIDLYKRGHFIMEAKQSYLKPEQEQLDLDDKPQAPSGARYDKLMGDAWLQARNYARNLPSGEPVAPFLIVCDVGRAFEIYVDPAGNGRDYDFFPDRQSYRIELPDLASEAEVARTGKTALELLRAIWTEPKKVDPRFQSAEVTRRVAKSLAEVMEHLEEDQRVRIKDIEESSMRSEVVEETSMFLMRILFCMFAEDTQLLPEKSFQKFLESCLISDEEPDNPNPIDQNQFRVGLERLWSLMGNEGGDRRSLILRADIRYFNGRLFDETKTFPLHANDLEKLIAAAKTDWRRVEPAIFGTLLEQALDPKERSKLGAHYTPRPYVETLVRATIMDVLEPEWESLQLEHEADEAALLEAALAFHDKLATIRVLDPACGTGNFLYVAMELLQALESRVLDLIDKLGGDARPRVGPQQFYGLELNPRAAKIAELVLWIGWLRNRLRDDPDAVPEPVLKRSANLNMGRRGRYDALLELDETGQFNPDDPQPSAWPEVEFIVGNPPFIGKGSAMREYLGDDYVDALMVANPRVAASADFVMQWWDRAAHVLVSDGSALKRFGFVTTNSITQEFSRRVIAGYLTSSPLEEEQEAPTGAEREGATARVAAGATNSSHTPLPQGEKILSLVMAIPDHPWTKATKDAAAVRIAMTVAARGGLEGCLREVTAEAKLDTDTPDIAIASVEGQINADLTVGADVTSAIPLRSNAGLSCNGMMLAGQGFKVLPETAADLTRKSGKDVSEVLKGYIGGGELLRGSSGYSVIDFCGLSEKEARQSYPALYDHLLRTVWEYEEVNKDGRIEKKGRKYNRRKALKEKWWIFAEPRKTFRPALVEIGRYIATTETSKHRVFQFVSTDTLPDHMVVAIGCEDAYKLGVLQSQLHTEWALRTGAWLGVGNDSRYSKSMVFDPFPFPDATKTQRATIAEIAEELDETRKLAIAETPKLTMTELYNLREKLRSGDPLSDKDAQRASAARAGIVDRLHELLDQAVADAYGWGEEWSAGQLGPSEIVARLVALNHERAAEEAEGHIRWLRPDYQIPRFAPEPDD